MNIVRENRIYSEKLKLCPLCGQDNISQKFFIESYKDPFRISECNECAFMFMNPPFSQEYISSLYDSDYYNGNANYAYHDERKHEKYHNHVWDARLKTIKRFVNKGRFLDVGCSFGGFMKRASRDFESYGIELSEYSGGKAREIFGERVHVGTLNNHPFKNTGFSVITMIEVIEHIADPAETIKECAQLLEPGGILVLQTANMDGLQARLLGENYAYFMPGHLSYFTASNLRKTLIHSGFRKVKVFFPVDFGLLPKLKKSRMNFKNATDYARWLRISLYHSLGKLHLGDRALMSSMTVYAVK